MKKIFTLLLALVTMALNVHATVTVCGVEPDENGHFSTSFIKSGSITWDSDSQTLTLDNAVIEYSSDNNYDDIYPININEDATIVIHGDCKLTTTGIVALALVGYEKSVTIQGDGSLYLSSTWIALRLRATKLTIKDITLNTTKAIADNNYGTLIGLTLDNVNAEIQQGGIERIGEGITLKNCSITYPEDAYIEYSDYGYFIANGSGNLASHVIISRSGGSKPGDLNGDGDVTIADAVAVLNAMAGETVSGNPDVNGDNDVTIADFVAVLNIMAQQ